MMFEYAFKLAEEAEIIKEAVDASIAKEFVTVDIAQRAQGQTTSEVGDWITSYIKNK